MVILTVLVVLALITCQFTAVPFNHAVEEPINESSDN